MSYVLLEDGTRFDGEAVGAPGPVTGEVVFNTAMSGYQEAMTDPSYAGQIITFTYPHIGNYGVRAARWSPTASTRAPRSCARRATPATRGAEGGWLDWLRDAACPRSPASTRARSCAISARPARCAANFPGQPREREAARVIAAEPPMAGLDLVPR